MQRIFKIFIPAAFLIALAALGVWWWHAHRHSQISFRTTELKRGDVETTINASGTIEPMEVVDVGAQVAGRIKSFGTDVDGKTVDYGSVIEEGAMLAKIDDSVYAADFAVAKAQVEQASAGISSAAANLGQMKAKLTQAEAEWKRAQSLYSSKLMAQTDYDTDQANYEVAKSDVSVAEAGVAEAKATAVQAQAGLEKAQRNLDFCTIQSPVKGVIIDRRVNIGQTVVASLNAPSLFLIAKDLTKMQIWVSVNEADVGRIKIGAPVSFTCSAFPGRRFEGKVAQVRLNATMTQNIVIYTVVVNTENSDKVLLPYLTASVDFLVRKETNALVVPNAALRWSPSALAEIAPDIRAKIQADPPGDPPAAANGETRGTIWLKEGDYVRPVEVKVGATDGVNTAITSDTLKEGAPVVTGASAGGMETTGSNPFLPSAVRW
jgi:HlyD family secretion protein